MIKINKKKILDKYIFGDIFEELKQRRAFSDLIDSKYKEIEKLSNDYKKFDEKFCKSEYDINHYKEFFMSHDFLLNKKILRVNSIKLRHDLQGNYHAVVFKLYELYNVFSPQPEMSIRKFMKFIIKNDLQIIPRRRLTEKYFNSL